MSSFENIVAAGKLERWMCIVVCVGAVSALVQCVAASQPFHIQVVVFSHELLNRVSDRVSPYRHDI